MQDPWGINTEEDEKAAQECRVIIKRTNIKKINNIQPFTKINYFSVDNEGSV